MPKKPPLALVSPVGTVVTLSEPPPTLGEAGLSLWRTVQAQYAIADAGGLEILRQACAACDRAAQYAAIIDEQGAVIVTKTGVREHPLVKAEIATRALVGRLITRLGLDIEALKPTPGRPPSPHGWAGPAR